MNEEHDINLPADADDLSKHAPVLFALKGTEEGFIVPALYFEELSELVVSKTSIPEEGGLVVPEIYFEESAELILAKTSIPENDGLIIPEKYFEESAELTMSKTSLSDFGCAQSDKEHSDLFVVPEKYFEEFTSNLESQITLESALPKTDNEVSAGYFEQMENELHVHIALDNVKQDEGFVVPGGYFEGLTDRVLAETVLNKEEINNDEIPAGYFESLHEKVITRIESENTPEGGRVIVLSQWKKYTAITAVAAAVALIVLFTWTFTRNDGNGNGTLRIANHNGIVPENFVKQEPKQIIDTASSNDIVVPKNNTPQLANNTPVIKPNEPLQVKMNDDEIIAQSDLMDEALVMDFVSESGVVEATEEALDPAMMEYLMNEHTSLDEFDPGNKR
jgi:hypothetical protein